MDKTELEISWATLWRIFAMVLLVITLFLARDVIVVIFLALIISAAFDAPITLLEEKGVPRVLGTVFIFLATLMVLAMILYTVIPLSIIELKDFLQHLNRLRLPVFGYLDTSRWIVSVDRNWGGLAGALFSGDLSFFNVVGTIFGNVITTIAILFLAFYLTVSRGGIEEFLRGILPIGYEDYVVSVYKRVRRKLGLWFQGQVILMLIVGVAVFLGLWILGVKYSFVLGILAGLLELVPVAGPIFTGILAFLVAVSKSWILGIYTLILFFVVQQLESNFLVPIVMRKRVGLSPIMVLIALLIGSEVAGVIGIILSIPTALIVQELIDDWEKRKLRRKNIRLEI